MSKWVERGMAALTDEALGVSVEAAEAALMHHVGANTGDHLEDYFGDAQSVDEQIKSMREAVAVALQSDGVDMRTFCREVLRQVFEGHDIDGADVQELAVKCGLLEEVTMTESCGDGCTCAEVTDFPTTCYRYTAVLK